MRLERVAYGSLCGFAGGELDLRLIPPGLVALTGQNYSGKTLLLETVLAALYRSFGSRQNEELPLYASGRDAWVEADFSVDGLGSYRARVNIDGVARKMHAVLTQLQPDGRHLPLNDGRVTTFDAAIAQIVPRKDGLLCSAFAAQNRAGALTSMPKAKRKDLFMQFLWLERYVTMAETAKTCWQIADVARRTLQAQRDGLAKETALEIQQGLANRRDALVTERAVRESRRVWLRPCIASREHERVTLAAQAHAHVAARERVTGLTAVVATRQAEIRQLERDAGAYAAQAVLDTAAADRRLRMQHAFVDRSLQAESTTLTAATDALLAKIANNRTVLQDAEAIRAAATFVEGAQTTLTGLRTEIAEARDAWTRATAQAAVRADLLATVAQAQQDLASCQRQTETVHTVPCDGIGPYAACRFLTDAQRAMTRIPELEGTIAQEPTLRAGKALWDAQAAEASALVTAREAESAALTRQVAQRQPLAKLASHVDTAEARIADRERQIAEKATETADRVRGLHAQRDAATEEHAQAQRDREARLATQGAALTARQAEAERALLDATTDLAQAAQTAEETASASERVNLLDIELATYRTEWTTVEAHLAGLAVRLEEVTRAIDALADRQRELVDVDRRLALVLELWTVQQLLATGLHRDGLPTLEIAAAGPTVSQICTDLLEHSGFGTRFSVSVVTQVATADGKGLREDFSVLVYDNAHGGNPRELGDMSGGEQTFVQEALRSACAIYVNSRNERAIRTLWRDEADSALDPENKLRYVAMLRRLRELGGVDHVLFISQSPDVVDLADTIVDVTDGTATIRRAA